MKFTGVPVGTTITVKESAAKNYKGSAKITINGTQLTPVSAAKYNARTYSRSNEKLGQKQNTVDVTNTYNDVPTTEASSPEHSSIRSDCPFAVMHLVLLWDSNAEDYRNNKIATRKGDVCGVAPPHPFLLIYASNEAKSVHTDLGDTRLPR